MAVGRIAQQRVRPRLEDSEDDQSLSDASNSAPEFQQNTANDGDDNDSSSDSEDSENPDDDDDDMDDIDEEEEADADPSLSTDLSNISFGALARAQDSLNSRSGRKSKAAPPAAASEKLGALRQRLREMDADKQAGKDAVQAASHNKDYQLHHASRSSKHAPAEVSSKKAVSRRREAVPVVQRKARDPRFEPVGGQLEEDKIKAKYSFLDSYREDEMKALREEIKKTKDEAAKERLKKALASMQSKREAQASKDKAQEIVREHRQKEKELIKQGKSPFYLKKTEQKRLALIDKYGSLKPKQLDKVLERKRKRKTAKERKMMPFARRGMEE
ncbi:MAG: hypothetical protein M1819_007224 [Sarea resinae]|nr:MAG: hypothetical protein M1819_007224 [Sarea resinae]